MQSRVKIIREAYGYTIERFAEIFGVHREWIAMAESALDSSDIPSTLISDISARYQIPKKFILGYPYKLRRQVDFWHPDEKEDYLKANSKMKLVLTAHFGYCDFTES